MLWIVNQKNERKCSSVRVPDFVQLRNLTAVFLKWATSTATAASANVHHVDAFLINIVLCGASSGDDSVLLSLLATCPSVYKEVAPCSCSIRWYEQSRACGRRHISIAVHISRDLGSEHRFCWVIVVLHTVRIVDKLRSAQAFTWRYCYGMGSSECCDSSTACQPVLFWSSERAFI